MSTGRALGNNLFTPNGLIATPSDDAKRLNGYIAWTDNTVLNATTITMVAATVYLQKIPLAGSGTSTVSVTNVVAFLGTKATSTLTHCYAGILTSSGTLIGMTADQSSSATRWDTSGSNGLTTMPLASGPFTVTPTGVDDYVIGVMYMGTTAGTAPKFSSPAATNTAAILNAGLSAAASRAATQSVADTTTPFASLTLSSNTATVNGIWMALS